MFDEYPDVIRPNELKAMLHIGRTKAYPADGLAEFFYP